MINELIESFNDIKNNISDMFDECEDVIDISDNPDIQQLILNNSWVYKPGYAKTLITILFGYKISFIFKGVLPIYIVRKR